MEDNDEQLYFDFRPDRPVLLQNSWCFWHDKFIGPSLTVQEYEAALQKICCFSTVQDFWNCYNNLPPVEKLKPKSSYHLMKAGVRPLWEDPENERGGFWVLRIRKEDTTYVWKELLLAVIGEQFAPALAKDDDICGLTVSVRQYDNIIQLWNKNAQANHSGLLTKIKQLIPNAEIKNAFYKTNYEHQAFEKKDSAAAASSATSSATPPKPDSNGSLSTSSTTK